MLVQYIRDDSRRPIGCVVALGRDKVGWSLCNPRDQFNKQFGKDVAIVRARTDGGQTNYVPKYRHLVLHSAIAKMYIRSEIYYKQDKQFDQNHTKMGIQTHET